MSTAKPPSSHSKSGRLFDEVGHAGFIVNFEEWDLDGTLDLCLGDLVGWADIEEGPTVLEKVFDVCGADVANLS